MKGLGRSLPRIAGRELAFLVALAAIGLALGLYRLDAKSIWHDEAVTAWATGRSVGTLLAILPSYDANFGLYYGLMLGWARVFGDSEFALRLPSVLCAVGASLVFYSAIARLFDIRTAATAALFLVTAAFVVEYAQEARSYTFALLLVTAALWAVSRLRWALFVVFGIASFYAHPWAGLAIGAMLVAILADRWRVAVATGAAIAIGVLPLIAYGMSSTATSWIKPMSLSGINWVATSLVRGVWPLLVVVVVASVSVAILGLIRRDRRVLLPLLLAWAPLLGTILVSVVRPMLVPRYLLFAFPGIAAVCAIACLALPRWFREAAVVGVIALNLVGVAAWYPAPRQDARAAAVTVTHDSRNGDVVLYSPPHTRTEMEYYFDKFGRSLKNLTGTEVPSDVQTVWVVASYGEGPEPPAVATIAQDLEQAGFHSTTHGDHYFMHVTKYVR